MAYITRVVSVVFLFFALVGAGGAEARVPYKIGVSVPEGDSGWMHGAIMEAKEAIRKAKEQKKNVQYFLVTAEEHHKQVMDIDNFIANGVDALVVLPINPDPLGASLKKVKSAGIYTILVDRISQKLPYDVSVTGDHKDFGAKVADYIVNTLTGEGSIIVMEGNSSTANTQRITSFKRVLSDYPDVHILDSQVMNWSPQKGVELLDLFLKRFPKIDAIWCGDDNVLLAVLQAYKESGRSDLKLLIGGGGAKEVVRLIMEGDPLVQATVVYPPGMIADAMNMAADHCLEGTNYETDVILPSSLVTRENAKVFYHPQSEY